MAFDIIYKLMRDRRGNVAVMTALCILPLIGMIGLAVDYAVALSNKSKLDAAADAAAIAAITTAQNTILANSGSTGTAIEDGKAQANKVFKANSATISFANDSPVPVVNLTRNETDQSLSATVTYAASNVNNFGYLFGAKIANIKGTVSSSLTLRKYINIYIVVDISQSMGIAATPQDMTTLFGLTGCVFGCHIGPNSNESVAHANNVTLRIDVIKSALSQMIDQAKAANGSPSTTNIGLYTMEFNLTTLMAPTTDYAALKRQAGNIDLGPDNDGGTSADSYASTSLQTLTGLVRSSGDGSSAATPQNYVFIMTDGTYDTYNAACQPAGYSHCVGPLDPSWNSIVQLKQNATVGVIYTVYNPIYKNNDINQGFDTNYGLLVAPIAGSISDKLKNCASSSKWFIQANNSSDIISALNTFLMQSLMSAHLVNQYFFIKIQIKTDAGRAARRAG